MSLNLKTITAISVDTYEATFESGTENAITAKFRVEYHKEIPLVQPDPDDFMRSVTNPREISAAVVAFHKARSGTDLS